MPSQPVISKSARKIELSVDMLVLVLAQQPLQKEIKICIKNAESFVLLCQSGSFLISWYIIHTTQLCMRCRIVDYVLLLFTCYYNYAVNHVGLIEINSDNLIIGKGIAQLVIHSQERRLGANLRFERSSITVLQWIFNNN